MHHTAFAQIGIIGAGEFGKALGEALAKTNAQVLYYDKDPSRTTTGSIDDLVRACPLLFVCVPSWEVANVAKQIHKAAHPTEARVLITVAKGVAPGFKTMDQVLRSALPKNYHIGVMYGPMIAEEISRDKASHAVMALSDSSLKDSLITTFEGTTIAIEVSGDVRGVALCGVLKNVYAIAFGVNDGLRLGLNVKGRLAVVALAEMKMLVSALGGDPRTAEGTAGLGDMLSTGFSGDSFNYRIGKSLAEGIIDPHVKSEGLVTLTELAHQVKLADYPLAHFVEQAAFHYAKPTQLVDVLQ